MYKRVLLKLSGEALSDKGSNAILGNVAVSSVADSIKRLYDGGVQVAIVNGAGNIWRGRIAESIGIERVPADYMGMLGTIINSVALASSLKRLGVPAVVFSALPAIEGITLPYNPEEVKRQLDQGKVCFLSGGVGKPFFTTDTACVKRALETNCDAILMAKNGTKGVYDKDPNKYDDALFFPEITYAKMEELNIQVMDKDAIELIKDTDLEILVFSMSDPNNFDKAARGENVGTICRRK